MKLKVSYKKSLALLALLSVAAAFVWSQIFVLAENSLNIYFLDVGQGDATYIRTPEGQDIIVDGGPDNLVLEKLGRYMPFYDKKIELIILTHPHEDHIAGLVDILKRYEVEHILYSGVGGDTAVYEIWDDLIRQGGADITIAEAGKKLSLGSVMVDVIYPLESMENKEIENLNNSSVVFKIIFENVSVVIMGDAEQEVEKELSDSYPEKLSNSTILKAGHHGSKTSNTQNFVELVNPKYAIISAGLNNRYNHPHKNSLDTFEKLDIEMFRTDVNGDIKCISEGVDFTCVGI